LPEADPQWWRLRVDQPAGCVGNRRRGEKIDTLTSDGATDGERGGDSGTVGHLMLREDVTSRAQAGSVYAARNG
jgi:hypothetical protein